MIQIKTKHKGNQLIIRHKLNQNEQVAYLEQSLIEQGEIPDLIPVSVQNRLLGLWMQFVLEDCVPLPEYLGAGISLEQFCRCLLEIIHIIQDCESHGISISNLEVRPQYIYYDVSRKKICMLYWPIHSMKEYPNIPGDVSCTGRQLCVQSTRSKCVFPVDVSAGKTGKTGSSGVGETDFAVYRDSEDKAETVSAVSYQQTALGGTEEISVFCRTAAGNL